MALTREQAMGMLFAPPWAPGTYDDATIWNDAHRKYPPANVPVGVPVDTRDAITAQLMQQPQSSPFGTGDTIRYPGGLAGGLGGEQPGYPDNPNLDLGQTNPVAPGPFSGITDPSQLGPVIGQPSRGATKGDDQVDTPEDLDAPPGAVIGGTQSSNQLGQSLGKDALAPSTGYVSPTTAFNPAVDIANAPGVSKGAPSLGSRGFSGPPALDPIDTVPAPAPTETRGGVATSLAEQQTNTAAKGALGGPMSTTANTSSAPTAPSVNAPMSAVFGAPELSPSMSVLGQSRGFGDVPDLSAPVIGGVQSANQVGYSTGKDTIGTTPASQTSPSAVVGVPTDVNGNPIGAPAPAPSIGIGQNGPAVTSTTTANPGTSLGQELAAMTGISTPASNNFGLSALGTSALEPTAAPSPVAAPTPPGFSVENVMSGLASVGQNAATVGNALGALSNDFGLDALGTSALGATAPAADPNAPDAMAAAPADMSVAAAAAQAQDAETNAAVGAALDAMGATGAPGDNAGGIGDPGATASYGDQGFGYGFGLGDTPGFADAPSAPDAPDSTSESDE